MRDRASAIIAHKFGVSEILRQPGKRDEMEQWDKLGEECGIFSIVGHPEAARMARSTAAAAVA